MDEHSDYSDDESIGKEEEEGVDGWILRIIAARDSLMSLALSGIPHCHLPLVFRKELC